MGRSGKHLPGVAIRLTRPTGNFSNKLCGLTVAPSQPCLALAFTPQHVLSAPCVRGPVTGNEGYRYCPSRVSTHFCLPTTLLLVSLFPILQMRPTKRASGRGTGHVPVSNWLCDLEQVASPAGVDPKFSPLWNTGPAHGDESSAAASGSGSRNVKA